MHHPCTHAMPCHAPVLSLSLSCLLVSLVRTRKCPCQLPGGRAPLYCGSCFSAQRHAQCRSQQSPAVPSLGGAPSVGGCRAFAVRHLPIDPTTHHSPIFSRHPIARVSQGSLASGCRTSPPSTDHPLTAPRIRDSRQTHAMPCRSYLAADCD
jgi:hypothetical protein